MTFTRSIAEPRAAISAPKTLAASAPLIGSTNPAADEAGGGATLRGHWGFDPAAYRRGIIARLVNPGEIAVALILGGAGVLLFWALGALARLYVLGGAV